jgi:hypothetical protein
MILQQKNGPQNMQQIKFFFNFYIKIVYIANITICIMKIKYKNKQIIEV